MLRPKSALFYIDEITGVSDDLLQLMVSEINAEKGFVDDVSPFLYRWSLEAVGSIFLDTRLDTLNTSYKTKRIRVTLFFATNLYKLF